MNLNILFLTIIGYLYFAFCELPNYFLYVFSIEVLTLFLSGFMDNFNIKATHILQIFSLVGRKLLIMEWI